MLDDGKIAAYFGDRSILVSLSKDSKAPEKLLLAEQSGGQTRSLPVETGTGGICQAV